jgi:hypothetical protein
MFFNFLAAYLITWIISSNAYKYVDYLVCGQSEPCKPNMVGCVPCQANFQSGVIALKQPYVILFVATIFVFILMFFGIYLITKKRFKF